MEGLDPYPYEKPYGNFEMRYISVYFLLFIIATLSPLGCNIFGPTRPEGRPVSLANFFEDNGYNLIYPLDSMPEPGAIYEETKEKGLGRPMAFKDVCAKDLETRQGEISFGEYTASSGFGIDFLIGLSKELIDAGLKGAFEKEVSYTVSSGLMPTLECDKATLTESIYNGSTSKYCKSILLQDNVVVLSKVVSVKKFTFKFNGLKKGGINVIFESFASAGLNVKKTNDETIVLEYDNPMKLCYQSFTPLELEFGDTFNIFTDEQIITGKEVKIKEVARLNSFTKEFFGIED